MDVNNPLALLGGLSPQQFMRRHWQKKPLLVRRAWPEVQPPLPRQALFALAAQDDVEARLVVQRGDTLTMKRGPLARRALPPLAEPGWTLLVQGLDLHVPAAHEMLSRFRFVPDARLDDLMVSYASDGGGVGPHTDAYDVFLLQVQGQRRWRVGPVKQPKWVADSPLKRLAEFDPLYDWLLAPGDMLYLPPHWGHDGVAVGPDCMTCSIGFRAPAGDELARELLLRLADEDQGEGDEGSDGDAGRVWPKKHYRDSQQAATPTPAALPQGLLDFAQAALARRLNEPHALARAVGEWASEPKPQVWFEAGPGIPHGQALRLHARTRMMYDPRHVFINGEAFVASGRDARLMQQLANQRWLSARDHAALSTGAAALVSQWGAAGWVEAITDAKS